MEKKNNKLSPASAILLIGIALILVLYYNLRPKNNIQNSTETQAAVNYKEASTEQLQACSQQASDNFNTIIALETKNEADLKEIRSYTNHFNTKESKCFMVITSNSPELGSKMQRLYDVYNNKMLASNWIVKDLKNPNNPINQNPSLCIIYEGAEANNGYGDCNVINIFKDKMETSTF